MNTQRIDISNLVRSILLIAIGIVIGISIVIGIGIGIGRIGGSPSSVSQRVVGSLDRQMVGQGFAVRTVASTVRVQRAGRLDVVALDRVAKGVVDVNVDGVFDGSLLV